jgi:hypothetical protein
LNSEKGESGQQNSPNSFRHAAFFHCVASLYGDF